MRMWPRCCSSAFIGTTKKPASPPITVRSTIAIQRSRASIMAITTIPMAMPSGITLTDCRNETMRAAITAPIAMPTATTPCSWAALFRGYPSAASAHFSTINCRVAPAPQNSVVTASEIWPSLSVHRSFMQCLNSCTRNTGFFFRIR